jgi:hypothetical protein
MLLRHDIAGVEGAGGQTVSHDVHQRVISRSVRVIVSKPAGGFSHLILPEIVMIITISSLAERSMRELERAISAGVMAGTDLPAIIYLLFVQNLFRRSPK